MSSRHKHYKATTFSGESDLFGGQEPPSVAIDTSEAAALAIQPKTGTLRSQVLSVIRGRGPRGATEREIEYVLRLPGNTVRPRLWELEGNVPAGRRPRTALIY